MFCSLLLSLGIQSCHGDLFTFAWSVIDLDVTESRWQQPKQLSGIQVMLSHLERVAVYSTDIYFISPDKNCWQEQPILRLTNWNRVLFPSLRADMTACVFNKSIQNMHNLRGFTWLCTGKKTFQPRSTMALFKLACQISFCFDLVRSY